MSAFTALNVEPEDHSEEEVDDTKEIQLEEAFKLYQNALKLHSQGPDFYEEALLAYQDLLHSEVFKYPEIISDYTHDQLDDDTILGSVQQEPASLSLLPSNAAESSANSIPHLVYLSYKNRGQFILDVARHNLKAPSSSRAELCQYYAKSCRESLKDFADALERDDTDLDLWKKAARVADVLSSQRIVRFCLESVLAGDDDDSDQTIDLSGLDEAFAAGELEEVIQVLEDDLSQSRGSATRPKQILLKALKKTSDPYRFLPPRSATLEYTDERRRPACLPVPPQTLRPLTRNASGLGQAILQKILLHQEDDSSLELSAMFTIELPETLRSYQDAKMTEAAASGGERNITNRRKSEPSTTMPPEVMQSPAEQNSESIDSGHEQKPHSGDETSALNSTTQKEGQDEEQLIPDSNSIKSKSGIENKAIELPTRKRSSTLAGNEEPEGRTKSKRLRARESIAELGTQDEEPSHESPQHYQEQLLSYEVVDQAFLDMINPILSKLEIPIYGSIKDIKTEFWQQPDSMEGPEGHIERHWEFPILADLRKVLTNWSDDKGQAILAGHGNQDYVEKSAGMTLFLQHSKAVAPKEIETLGSTNEDELVNFVEFSNKMPSILYDIGIHWLMFVLTKSDTETGHTSPYLRDTWSAEMKQTVVQLIVSMEEQMCEFVERSYQALTGKWDGVARPSQMADIDSLSTLAEFVQSVLELHLDIYFLITNPSSQVDQDTRLKQSDRLSRWAVLTNDFMQMYVHVKNPNDVEDSLILRFVWASTIYSNQADEINKAHVMLCLQDLRRVFEKPGVESINLPNNAAMPQISMSALDQEISRLSTLDFFMSVFESDNDDPVAIIEKLEPVLEVDEASRQDLPDTDCNEETTRQIRQLTRFLHSGDGALKLFLWRRLQNAYTAISYTPKVVSCLLRAIETMTDELSTIRHMENDESHRQLAMLKWLRDIDELVIKVLVRVQNEPNAYECVDATHLKRILRSTTCWSKLLHGATLFEDSVRVGQTSAPSLKGASSSRLYEKSREKMREMQVRLWTLQYTLLKESMTQFKNSFADVDDILAEYLSKIHAMLGIRQYCKYSNKLFVKLVKSELRELKPEVDYSEDVAQVLFDLYQLRLAPGFGDADHGCQPEAVDKKTAISLIPTLMEYANRLNVRDLLKSELKSTIDKVQQASGAAKSSPVLHYNKRLISAYLKASVDPNELYRCVKGIGDLPTKPVNSDTKVAADHGWYFLLGHMTLAKYRSVKRVNPTPTEDLDVAATFLRQDLDYGIEKWETWYRLAQVYDAKIEDDLIWNSTKLNDSRSDIATMERHAIHAYTMSIAVAMRSADDGWEISRKIGDMFAEFALRLYSSSRPPLSMEAFRTDKHVRHLSSSVDRTMSKEPYHRPMEPHAVWSFAAYLLRQKFTDKPKPWINHYTLGKCLWKIFQSPFNTKSRQTVSAESVLEVLIDAIETLPKKEKSNEYILEPHFKLVSIVHKMVSRKALAPAVAVEYLQATRYAQKVHLSEDDQGPEWEPYVLEILKKLGQADKSNWHHRIIARAAHVIYDGQFNIAGALGAKHEFTQQIFTKTMTLQVWKPEFERPGRHYVYTGLYVSFFVRLLDELNDRASLDQLVRRIRRRATDFLNHTKLWEEVTTTYVRLLRRMGKVPEGRERTLFDSLSYEEFTKQSDKLEKWALDPDTSSIVLDIMRDAIELKKLNNSLMKGTLIDDLIGDAYACMYEAYVSQLPPEETSMTHTNSLPQGTFINITAENTAAGVENRDRMSLGNLLASQGDGIADKSPVKSLTDLMGLGVQSGAREINETSPSQPSIEAIRISTPSKPGRAKTITRREVQRKAEAAIVKPPPIKTPILSKRPALDVPSENQSYFSGHGESAFNARLENLKEGEGQESGASSRRSSIHDSADAEGDGDADDESELSELEELDEEMLENKKSMFPGLMSSKNGGDQGVPAGSVDGSNESDNDGVDDTDTISVNVEQGIPDEQRKHEEMDDTGSIPEDAEADGQGNEGD